MIEFKLSSIAAVEYSSPQCEVLCLDSASVLCQSGGTEDYYVVDPWN